MEETLISFKTAKLAKEKGFDLEVPCFFDKEGLNIPDVYDYGKGNWNHGDYNNSWSAPTQSLLQKWLREKHNIHVGVNCDLFDDLTSMCFRGFEVIKMDKYRKLDDSVEVLNTYEAALEAGLLSALKLIK